MDDQEKYGNFKQNYDKIVSKFKEELGKKISNNRIIVESSSKYSYGVIYKIFAEQQEDVDGYDFFIRSIDEVESYGELPIVSNIVLNKEKDADDVIINQRQGLFKVSFSDGTFMMFSSWHRFNGDGFHIESLFACERKTWVNFLNIFNERNKKRVAVPNGEVYKFDGSTNKYIQREVRKTPVIHPTVAKVTEDLEHFFSHIDNFTRHNMPGVRKVMLVGPPGTGKTSLLLRIADKYKKEHNVTFFTDIGSLAKHLHFCSKQNVSTVCFLEDAESSLGRADSSILNVLDGVDQPIVSKGAYVIMTTNYPQRIEPRILQRPGRVDQIFPFDLLKGDNAMECAKLYMNEILFGKKKVVDATKKQILTRLEDILDIHSKGVSGTRVKQFSEDVLRYVVSRNKDKITLDELQEVFEMAEKNIKDVYKMAQESGLMDETSAFSWDEAPKERESYDEHFKM